MKILNLAETRAALPFGPLIEAIDRGFRSGATSPLRHHHAMRNTQANIPARDDMLLLMPAWQDRADGASFGGVKIVNVHPSNADRGLPAIASSYILFDRDTGAHLLLLDGGELTARRTAAASVLAAKRLARPDSRKLLVMGAGRVGENVIKAYSTAFELDQIEIWSRSESSSKALEDNLSAQGHPVTAVTDLEAAVGRADIVSCATLAIDPILNGDWLKPGQHVDLIGSFTPEMREADDTAIQRARVFIDTDHAKVESGDIAAPLANGCLQDSEIGNLDHLCREDLFPRKEDQEITLFKGVGSALEDLAAASLAFSTL